MRFSGGRENKRKLIPILRRFWNDSMKRYLEPFAGSACLFFALKAAKPIIGDINTEFIESYNVIRREPEKCIGGFERARRSPRQLLSDSNLDPKISLLYGTQFGSISKPILF